MVDFSNIQFGLVSNIYLANYLPVIGGIFTTAWTSGTNLRPHPCICLMFMFWDQYFKI